MFYVAFHLRYVNLTFSIDTTQKRSGFPKINLPVSGAFLRSRLILLANLLFPPIVFSLYYDNNIYGVPHF